MIRTTALGALAATALAACNDGSPVYEVYSDAPVGVTRTYTEGNSGTHFTADCTGATAAGDSCVLDYGINEKGYQGGFVTCNGDEYDWRNAWAVTGASPTTGTGAAITCDATHTGNVFDYNPYTVGQCLEECQGFVATAGYTNGTCDTLGAFCEPGCDADDYFVTGADITLTCATEGTAFPAPTQGCQEKLCATQIGLTGYTITENELKAGAGNFNVTAVCADGYFETVSGTAPAASTCAATSLTTLAYTISGCSQKCPALVTGQGYTSSAPLVNDDSGTRTVTCAAGYRNDTAIDSVDVSCDYARNNSAGFEYQTPYTSLVCVAITCTMPATVTASNGVLGVATTGTMAGAAQFTVSCDGAKGWFLNDTTAAHIAASTPYVTDTVTCDINGDWPNSPAEWSCERNLCDNSTASLPVTSNNYDPAACGFTPVQNAAGDATCSGSTIDFTAGYEGAVLTCNSRTGTGEVGVWVQTTGATRIDDYCASGSFTGGTFAAAEVGDNLAYVCTAPTTHYAKDAGSNVVTCKGHAGNKTAYWDDAADVANVECVENECTAKDAAGWATYGISYADATNVTVTDLGAQTTLPGYTGTATVTCPVNGAAFVVVPAQPTCKAYWDEAGVCTAAQYAETNNATGFTATTANDDGASVWSTAGAAACCHARCSVDASRVGYYTTDDLSTAGDKTIYCPLGQTNSSAENSETWQCVYANGTAGAGLNKISSNTLTCEALTCPVVAIAGGTDLALTTYSATTGAAFSSANTGTASSVACDTGNSGGGNVYCSYDSTPATPADYMGVWKIMNGATAWKLASPTCSAVKCPANSNGTGTSTGCDCSADYGAYGDDTWATNYNTKLGGNGIAATAAAYQAYCDGAACNSTNAWNVTAAVDYAACNAAVTGAAGGCTPTKAAVPATAANGYTCTAVNPLVCTDGTGAFDAATTCTALAVNCAETPVTTACTSACGMDVTYTVTQEAQNGGTACSTSNGQCVNGDGACTSGTAPTPSSTPAPVPYVLVITVNTTSGVCPALNATEAAAFGAALVDQFIVQAPTISGTFTTDYDASACTIDIKLANLAIADQPGMNALFNGVLDDPTKKDALNAALAPYGITADKATVVDPPTQPNTDGGDTTTAAPAPDSANALTASLSLIAAMIFALRN